MSDRVSTPPSVAASGTLTLGGEITVHRLGFGAMRVTGPGVWGPPADPAECRRVLRRAVELGTDFIDTADSYGPAVSEDLIAAALHPYPEGLVLATKAGFDRPGPDQWVMNGRPEHLRAACDASLRRLRVERIALYQLHRIDPKVPAEDQLGTLAELQRAGKVRLLGLSEVTVEQVRHAQRFFRVASVQNRYNVQDRGWEPVLELCESEGIAFIPWYPLATGKLERHGAVAQVARRQGATPPQVGLAWLLARSRVMLPIPGTSKVAHLEENVAAAALTLSAADRRALAAV
jgi:aryl-alcohol dehydrogenase-like predicted oxidoreductase